MSRLRRLGRDPIVLSLAAVLAATALFLAWPRLDLLGSALFYVSGEGFPASRWWPLQALRRSSDIVVWLLVAVLLGGLVLRAVRPALPNPIRTGDALVLLLALALGPGLLVNVGLKDNWGRPRPVDVDAFGGAHPYVPVWRVSDACDDNCSFVSGEGSSAAWIAAALIVLAPARRRRLAVAASLAYAAALSLNRIAFGGHFPSDVVLAWSLTALVLALCRRLVDRGLRGRWSG